jgi:predicted O-linked N-acetylglucosamine transferase (SPINDLY family)
MARHRLASLFLDTSPYNAHTTASDALNMGVPVLTTPGETFASRAAASQLRAAGVSELITSSLADYEALALKLARDPDALSALKAKLEQAGQTAPLFNTARYTRHLEAAFTQMVERFRRGEVPGPITIAPLA